MARQGGSRWLFLAVWWAKGPLVSRCLLSGAVGLGWGRRALGGERVEQGRFGWCPSWHRPLEASQGTSDHTRGGSASPGALLTPAPRNRKTHDEGGRLAKRKVEELDFGSGVAGKAVTAGWKGGQRWLEKRSAGDFWQVQTIWRVVEGGCKG